MIEQINNFFTVPMIYLWLNLGVLPFWLVLLFFPSSGVSKYMVRSIFPFMIFSFIFGLCYGSFEISCNLYASNLEKREKKSMMSGFHAFWSLGVLIGSISTSLFLEWDISFLNSYWLVELDLHS